MNVGSAIAIYFVIWWIGLFAVLPWGIRSQHEEGEVVKGSDPGAPSRPRLLRIVFVNTIFATVIFVVYYLVWTRGLISLDDIPFLPEPAAGLPK
jgi:predicted secreted protein